MNLEDSEAGIRIDADFECGSSGEIRKVGERSYVSEPQPEPIPDWFYQALQEHFAGAGVPREYACHVRVASSAAECQRLALRFVFTETSGKGYMPPPYWIWRGRRWRPIAAAATHYVENVHVDLEFDIDPGERAPLETRHLWRYMSALRPTAYMEFHTHYQDVRAHKLNPMALEWFPEDMRERVERVEQALLEINADWRVTPLEKSLPLVDSGKFANLTQYFHTLSYCYQIYAISEEATCAHATTAIAELVRALAGPEWLAQQPKSRIERG